jgi:UDP-2,4-diacetamido-2,4,6-trideoxy-beta-L-altropyranose hydrolase
MRCLALADALRECGRTSLFLSGPDGNALAETVSARGHRQYILPAAPANEATDADLTRQSIAALGGCDAIVVDHYHLGHAWEQAIAATGRPLAVIDDLARAHCCDFLLDQNIVDASDPYQGRVPEDCHCCLGPTYALLHPDFRRLRELAPVRSSICNLLIFFGGSDPGNETGKALRGVLAASADWQIDVVIGAANPHRAELNDLCAASPGRVRLHVQTDRMAEIMAGADLAIGAGGSASWERCCLRLPAIATVLADNQAGIAASLDRLGALRSLGESAGLGPADYADAVLGLSGGMIARMSEVAGKLVDGQGATRVAAALVRCIEDFRRSES